MATYAVAASVVTGYKARVAVTVTTPGSGVTMTLYRVVGSVESPVAGAVDVPAVTTVVDDAELTLHSSPTYRMRASDGGTAVSGAVVASAPTAVLSEPQGGAWALVEVADWGERETDSRAERLLIELSSTVVVSHDVEVDPWQTLVVHTDTLAADAQVQSMSASGRPLLLRWPADTGEGDAWLHSVGGRRRYRYNPDDPTVRHSWPSMQLVPADLSRRAQGDTYADLKRYFAGTETYAVMKAEWPTYAALKAADLKAV